MGKNRLTKKGREERVEMWEASIRYKKEGGYIEKVAIREEAEERDNVRQGAIEGRTG